MCSRLNSFIRFIGILALATSCATTEPASIQPLDQFAELSDSVLEKQLSNASISGKGRIKDQDLIRLFMASEPERLVTNGKMNVEVYVQKPSCLDAEGLSYLSQQLDLAVLKLPDVVGSKRIGLDSDLFMSRRLQFFVFKSQQAARVAHAAYARSVRGEKVLEPVIFASCSDLNSYDSNIIREYARLYFYQSWSPEVRDAMASFIQAVLNYPSHVPELVPMQQIHTDARAAIKNTDNKNMVSMVGTRITKAARPANLAQMADLEKLNASFTGYLAQKYGIQKVREIIENDRLDLDPYKKFIGVNVTVLRQQWLKDLYGRAGYIQVTQGK